MKRKIEKLCRISYHHLNAIIKTIFEDELLTKEIAEKNILGNNASREHNNVFFLILYEKGGFVEDGRKQS